MKATIVTIGDEILIGQITDTNSGFIAKSLDKIGVDVHEMISISDDKNHIISTFEKLQDKVELAIFTGGLGPTKDDITKKTFCEYFDDELVLDERVLTHVTEMVEKFFKRPITQLNRDQALVPSKATVLFNSYGTAPGMWMKKGNTVFISLPGVPFEMKNLVESEIIPRIIKEYDRPYIIHKTIMTYGIGESLLAETIADWENSLPEFIKLAYLPSPGRVRLRLSARGKDRALLDASISEQTDKLYGIIGEAIVGFEEDESIEAVTGKLLKQKGKTIATAESVTGGKIAQTIASIPGASAYFKGSIVAYSAKIKMDLLDVSAETIEKFSVVSAEVATEMAANSKRIFGTDFAIGITGNAGPTLDNATEAKAGTVFIALATPQNIICEAFDFGQPREKVIDRAVNKSLEMLRKEILKIVV